MLPHAPGKLRVDHQGATAGGRNRSASTTPSAVGLAPIPVASVTAATIAPPGQSASSRPSQSDRNACCDARRALFAGAVTV